MGGIEGNRRGIEGGIEGTLLAIFLTAPFSKQESNVPLSLPKYFVPNFSEDC